MHQGSTPQGGSPPCAVLWGRLCHTRTGRSFAGALTWSNHFILMAAWVSDTVMLMLNRADVSTMAMGRLLLSAYIL